MGCGGFTCSKNALAALNVLYILVAFILIGVAAYGKVVAILTSISIMSGIIACGVFLLLIAFIGLIGAIKHHQVLLFFYMIILFLIFLVQFAVACACLAISADHQKRIAMAGWQSSSPDIKSQVQNHFQCCGFDVDSQGNVESGDKMYHPKCEALICCSDTPNFTCCSGVAPVNSTETDQTCPTKCETCLEAIRDTMDHALKISGGIGLFFSFTEIIGVWLALRFRNQKDPRANPSAFL